MNIDPNEEFKSLRDEILKWQEKRFEIMKAACVGLGVVVGGAVAQKNIWDWTLAVSAVHVILALAAHLTRTCSYFTTMGGAYIEVFLGGQWDAHSSAFRKKASVPQLNRVIAFIYLALGLTSNIICFTLCARNPFGPLTLLWLVSGIIMLGSLIFLAKKSYQRDEIVNYWKEVKADLKRNSDTNEIKY